MSNSEQDPTGTTITWKPEFSHPDPSVQKEDEYVHWKPDVVPNRGTTDSTSEASSQVQNYWKPDFLSPTNSSNNQGTTKPTESSTSSSENTQGPTSTNAGSNNASSSNTGSTNASSTTPATTNPNSTSANGSNISTSNGASNDAKPANGTGNADGSSTGSSSGASTTQPGSNQPTTGGSQPTPKPGTTVEKPTGGQPSSGGAMTSADPWNASSGKVDDKGLVQSPARGGTGGTPFSDASFVSSPQTASITAVKIHSKTGIDRIQICYGGKWAEAHGGSAGLQGLSEETFYLQRGEAIVQIEGRSGTKVVPERRSFRNEGRFLAVHHQYRSGKKLVYISGRSGDQVDSLQSYWVA